MNRPLHLLLIDDNPDDRSLVIRELRREWPNLQANQVSDAAALDTALSAEPFDLVITDYQLGWTDGVKILKRVKSLSPECPVLMFTGTGSEEIAVEAMKLGLDDYVLKSPKQFGRLCAAARNALRLSRQKWEVREAETKYAALFEAVPIGIYRMSPAGQILDANAALIEMLGYPDRKSLLPVNAAELHADPVEFRAWREKMERAGSVSYFETKLRRFDGSVCWVENRGKAVRDVKTRAVYYEGSVEDITERKRSEAEREHLIEELQRALGQMVKQKNIEEEHNYHIH